MIQSIQTGKNLKSNIDDIVKILSDEIEKDQIETQLELQQKRMEAEKKLKMVNIFRSFIILFIFIFFIPLDDH